jgi:hypothetical protein
MKKELIKAMINLLKVRSLMTLSVLIVFVTLSLQGRMSEEQTAFVIGAVITYYFNRSDDK